MSSAMDTSGEITADALFAQRGEMAAMMREKDWSKTPLGSAEHWPQSLRTAVGICLASPLPTLIWWSPHLVLLYNDAYRPLVGDAHPAALGAAGKDVWPGTWRDTEPMVTAALYQGVSSMSENQPTAHAKNDAGDVRYFTFSYSPIYGEGGVEGVFTTAIEMAPSVLAEQQLLERELGARAALIEATFEAIVDAVFVYDREGQIVRMNSAARDLFALDTLPDYAERSPDERTQLISARDELGNPIPSEQSGLHQLLHGEVLTGANALDVQVRLTDGRELDVNITGAPLTDEMGAITGAIAISRDVTRRRRLERAERWQASMLDRVHDAIFMRELDGRIVYWNHGAELLYGFTKDEAVGHISHDMLQTHLPLARSRCAALLQREGEWTGEVTHTTKDGRQLVVSSRQQMVREPDGRRFVLETNRDVTEQKYLLEALRQSEEKFRQLADAMPQFVWTARHDGYHDYFNSRWFGYTGLTFAQSEGWGWQMALHPDDAQACRDAWNHAVTTGKPYEIEYRLKRAADGAYLWHLGRGVPIGDERGRITTWYGSSTNIDDQKRLAEHTHDALQTLLAMAEVLVEGDTSSESDQNGQSDAQNTTDDAFGAGRDSLSPVDMRSLDTTTRQTVQEVLTLARHALPGSYVAAVVINQELGEIRPLAAAGLTADGERQWWRGLDHAPVEEFVSPHLLAQLYAEDAIILNATIEPPSSGQNYWRVTSALIIPVRLDAQRMVLLAVAVPDHGVFTRQERDLAQATARLVALVVERQRLTRDREAARRAALVLEETNRRMNDFLSIASHELRTPLTSIQANVQIIKRRLNQFAEPARSLPDTPMSVADAHEQLAPLSVLAERTERQMRRLDRLIGDFLDATRIQAGKLEYQLEPCDLVAITRETVEAQRAAWPERLITLAMDQPEIAIFGDADRIGQVVTNYLTNALKYSAPDQMVAVRIGMRDDTARVEVRDHGPGLEPEQQVGLFERFYRVPGIEQRSGSGVGLGLGLSISRTIIERHGGEVGVESAPGEGSTFWFTIPVHDSGGVSIVAPM